MDQDAKDQPEQASLTERPGPSLLEHARDTADFGVGLALCGGVCWVLPCGGSSPKNGVSHQLTSAKTKLQHFEHHSHY